MMVSTSDSGDPARINLKMLSTESPEKRADSFCPGSTLDENSAGDCVALSISFPFSATPPKRRRPTMFRLKVTGEEDYGEDGH
jgi:hypothetical protein